jgi:hypothetical protein
MTAENVYSPHPAKVLEGRRETSESFRLVLDMPCPIGGELGDIARMIK